MDKCSINKIEKKKTACFWCRSSFLFLDKFCTNVKFFQNAPICITNKSCFSIYILKLDVAFPFPCITPVLKIHRRLFPGNFIYRWPVRTMPIEDTLIDDHGLIKITVCLDCLSCLHHKPSITSHYKFFDQEDLAIRY